MTGARWDASGTIHTSRKFYLENEVRYPAQILAGLLLYQHKPRQKFKPLYSAMRDCKDFHSIVLSFECTKSLVELDLLLPGINFVTVPPRDDIYISLLNTYYLKSD